MNSERAIFFMLASVLRYRRQARKTNDAPVTKTLLYLLLEDCFGLGRWERSRQDRLDYWNTILLASVDAQHTRRTQQLS